MGNNIYKNVTFCFKKENIKDKEMFQLIDSLIKNNKKYQEIIMESKFFSKEFSLIHYWEDYSKDYLQNCFFNGYEYPDNYIVPFKDKELIDENARGLERYPDIHSIEGLKVDRIANIFLNVKNKVRDPDNSNGCLVFTFCHTKDGTWYLRIVFPEFYDPIPTYRF